MAPPLSLVSFFVGISIVFGSFSLKAQSFKKAPPPLFPSGWTWIEASGTKLAETKTMLRQLLVKQGHPIPEVKEARMRQLACYENGWIYEVEGKRGDTMRLYSMLVFPGARYLLTGETTTIYKANRTHGVLLEKFSAQKDYARLFIGSMVSERGRFRAFELSGELMPFETPASFTHSTGIFEYRKSMRKDQPAEITVSIKLQNEFFNATISINDTGLIEMVDERFLFNTPVYSEFFDQGGFVLLYKPKSVAGVFHSDDRSADVYFRKGTEGLQKATTQEEVRLACQGIEDAAALGHPPALRYIGEMFKNGYWGSKDEQVANTLFGRAYDIERSKLPKAEDPAEKPENVVERDKAIARRYAGFKTIIPLSYYSGQLGVHRITLFADPFEHDGYFYDAFIIQPRETGFLYWSVNDMQDLPFGWFLLEYDRDESVLEKANKDGFIHGFRMVENRKKMIQKSDASLKKGKDYIMWFRFQEKKDYGDKPVQFTTSLNLLKDASASLEEFFGIKKEAGGR